MKKIVLATGGFDPIHSGHISYLKAAKELGDILIVGLNSDEWLERKKGKAFMPWNERLAILNNLQMVDEVFTFMDDDDTAINFIKQVNAHYPFDQLIFVNGGDRTADNVPEMVFKDIDFVFGVGGDDKKNSSSWILEEWKTLNTVRDWGYWRVLDDKKTVKVKELVIMPGKSLSNQRHKFRNETWHVIKGECKIQFDDNNLTTTATTGDINIIPIMTWHRAYNDTDEPCHIIEIQSGETCTEEDIERTE